MTESYSFQKPIYGKSIFPIKENSFSSREDDSDFPSKNQDFQFYYEDFVITKKPITLHEFYTLVFDPDLCSFDQAKQIFQLLYTSISIVEINHLILSYIPIFDVYYEFSCPISKSGLLTLSTPISFTFKYANGQLESENKRFLNGEIIDITTDSDRKYSLDYKGKKSFSGRMVNDSTSRDIKCTLCDNNIRFIYNDICNECHYDECMSIHYSKHSPNCPELCDFYLRGLLRFSNKIGFTCIQCKKYGKKCKSCQKYKTSLSVYGCDMISGIIGFSFWNHLITDNTKEITITAQYCKVYSETIMPVWILTSAI